MRGDSRIHPPKEVRDLNLIRELENNPIVSQRELARKLGMALGVTNACLRDMAGKGWIRIRPSGHHKTAYYVTSKGTMEKARLMGKVFCLSVHHFSRIKELMKDLFLDLQQSGIQRVVFYGVSEEMEVAFLTLQCVPLKLAGIIEDQGLEIRREFLGCEVKDVSEVASLSPDAILITALDGCDKRAERIKGFIDPKSVWIGAISNGMSNR